MQKIEDWPFDQAPNVAAITTRQVITEGLPILRVTHFSEDHSWAFVCGTTDADADGRVIGMGEVLTMDSTLREVADLPPGWSATREKVGGVWQRFQDEFQEPDLPRWVQVPAGIFFGLVILLCLAGSAALVFSLNEKAQIAAPVLGIVLAIPCLWALVKCVRLITGRRTKGGLLGPTALRIIAWFFLVLPVGGLFTGYFRTHTVVAIVQTVAYIGIFAGLRTLATSRERAEAYKKSVETTRDQSGNRGSLGP